MKIDDTIMGFAEYNAKEYPFIYENEILKLMPPSVSAWREEQHNLLVSMSEWGKSIHNQEWIGNSVINGKAHNGNKIVFWVSNDSSNNNGFISFSVIYFFEYRNEKVSPNTIKGFAVTGREVDDFYDPGRTFETEMIFEEKRLKSTNIKVTTEEQTIGSYQYKDCEVSVGISAIPTYHSRSDTPLTAQSMLKFIFSEPQDLEFVIDVFWHCKKMLFYVCGRTNIQLNDIQVYGIENEKISNEGVIRICISTNEEETDIKRTKKIIKYEYIKNKMCLLLASIAADSMYFENLCSSIQATHSFGIDRIILNFVAFEREYRNLYSEEIVRSEEYYEVKDKVLQCLEEMRKGYTGKKKKYVKSFIDSFSKSENKYADRMNIALTDCEEILLPFLYQNYSGYNSDMIEEIGDRMNKLRNDSAHGDIDLTIEPINISDFATLENLLYAMRLKNMGVELMDIRRAIRDLKNYSVVISETE